MATPWTAGAPRRARWAALGVLGVGALAMLGRLPLTSAAFTATTASSGSSFAAASSFCASPGSTTTSVVNDTMVVQKSPDATFGSASPIEVRSHLNDNKRVFVRPSIPTIGARCHFTSAVLTFTVVGFRGGRTYDVYRAAADWNVNTLTWNNKPGLAGVPASAAITSGSWSVDVTSHVQALAGGTNVGLVVKDATEDSAADLNNKLGSIDGGQAATITFTWG